MMITTFGLPSGFTQFAISIARVMTDVVLRDVDYVSNTDIAGLRQAWAARSKPNLFFFADCPERQVVELFLKTKAPVLMIYEDPEDATGFIARERQIDFLWAARLTNQCMEALGDFFGQRNTLVIRRSELLDYGTFFRRVSAHFGIELTDAHLADIMALLDSSGETTTSTLLETSMLEQYSYARAQDQSIDDASPMERQALDKLHATLRKIGDGDTLHRVIWPYQFFIPGSHPNSALVEPIDLTGPARCVAYGPYLNLGIGVWKVAINLQIYGNFSGNRLEIDIYIHDIIHSERFQLPAEGRLVATAIFSVTDPRDAIQIRMITVEGAIEGALSMGDALITRAEDELQF